jgi:hypothetical protein
MLVSRALTPDDDTQIAPRSICLLENLVVAHWTRNSSPFLKANVHFTLQNSLPYCHILSRVSLIHALILFKMQFTVLQLCLGLPSGLFSPGTKKCKDIPVTGCGGP